jgi:hypothetical protein
MTERRDQRTSVRAPGYIDGSWSGASGSVSGRIASLSTTGCFVESIAWVDRGAQIRVKLELPDHPLELDAQVVTVDRGIGFAVRFVAVTPDVQRVLDETVERLIQRKK